MTHILVYIWSMYYFCSPWDIVRYIYVNYMGIFLCSSQINVGRESLYWGLLVKSAALVVSWNPTLVGSRSRFIFYRYQAVFPCMQLRFLQAFLNFPFLLQFQFLWNADLMLIWELYEYRHKYYGLGPWCSRLIPYSSYITMFLLLRFSLLYLQHWVWCPCICAGYIYY